MCMYLQLKTWEVAHCQNDKIKFILGIAAIFKNFPLLSLKYIHDVLLKNIMTYFVTVWYVTLMMHSSRCNIKKKNPETNKNVFRAVVSEWQKIHSFWAWKERSMEVNWRQKFVKIIQDTIDDDWSHSKKDWRNISNLSSHIIGTLIRKGYSSLFPEVSKTISIEPRMFLEWNHNDGQRNVLHIIWVFLNIYKLIISIH